MKLKKLIEELQNNLDLDDDVIIYLPCFLSHLDDLGTDVFIPKKFNIKVEDSHLVLTNKSETKLLAEFNKMVKLKLEKSNNNNSNEET